MVKRMKIDYIDINTKGIKATNYQNLNEYYQKKYFKFIDSEGKLAIAATEDCSIEFGKEKIFRVKQEDFIEILERDFAEENSSWAINYLSNKSPSSSAKNVSYIKSIAGFSIIFTAFLFLFINLFNVLNNIAYLTQNLLKAVLFNRSLVQREKSPLAKLSDDLPVYSVLIPLYREEFKVKAILQAMDKMNYPKDKLDVKLIIENDDILTKRTIAVNNIPDYVQVIKVPFSLPRTKPKALNYSIAFLKGEYVTIYDAEDIPDPDQLLKAVHAFRSLPENYACIQAKLNFYNQNENFLTKFFSIEYSVWFEYLLRGLSLLDLPVTLGGTSNHFKVSKLAEALYWDPYNVTEDADLGIRLYMKGYKVHLINSTTMEEAPNDVLTWIAQRARWIKGFIQTFFVFIKTKKDYKRFGFLKIASVYIFVGLSTYSFFCLPWLFLIFMLEINHNIYYLWMINSLFSFSYMYAIAYLVIKNSKPPMSKLTIKDWITLIIWPAYFILHTIACYRAFWETIKSPFKWNKTPHGIKKEV